MFYWKRVTISWSQMFKAQAQEVSVSLTEQLVNLVLKQCVTGFLQNISSTCSNIFLLATKVLMKYI